MEEPTLADIEREFGIEPYVPFSKFGLLVGMSVQSLTALVPEGFPAVKMGGRWRIQPSKGIKWLTDREEARAESEHKRKAKQAEAARKALAAKKKE